MDRKRLIAEITELVVARLSQEKGSVAVPGGRNEGSFAVVLTEPGEHMETFASAVAAASSCRWSFYLSGDMPPGYAEKMFSFPGAEFFPELPPSWKSRIVSYDAFLVPVLTMTVCSKIASLIADDMASKLLIQALLEQRKIFAGSEEMAFLRTFSARLPKALVGILGENLDRLHALGISEVPVKHMVEKACGVRKSQESSFSGNVITKEDVEAAAASGADKMEFRYGTIVTPLAKDYARDMNIRLILR